ncbi:MAG: sensor histidine kinase [Leptolyngbya sp. SIO4C1]|nr:sensor histidine kinase [Leptolyngbya sp. SIO4C1]
MFQATRRRLALWYTTVTAVLLLLFASGIYVYVRNTLVERVDDTLNHVVEIVQRSLVVEVNEPSPVSSRALTASGVIEPSLRVNVEDSFRDNAQAVEDDHIDLEWFSAAGELRWTTFSEPIFVPLHVNPDGETVHLSDRQILRQITHRVQIRNQVLGYLRVSHPWFEVTVPSRRLLVDLCVWSGLLIVATAAIGWLLSGLAMAPMRTSYQQLKQFTADASHELRNPIAVIQTNAQVALSDPEPDVAFQQDQLQVIERLTRRLGRLVDNLLFLARQDSGLVPVQDESLDLNALLKEVIEEQQAVAQEKQLELTYQPAAASCWISGDRDQLIRLFTNLIANALLYTPAAGTVQLTLQPVKQPGALAYLITIQDTGIGIESDALAHVFDRFYRVDPARSRRSASGDGSGLGLAIAKAIVDNHRGQISLTSEPGRGTTASVLLPQNR